MVQRSEESHVDARERLGGMAVRYPTSPHPPLTPHEEGTHLYETIYICYRIY
jgi:hypothetical protein